MSVDITYCINFECPMFDSCKRGEYKGRKESMSYAMFVNDDDSCEFFIKKDEAKERCR